ncbi:MAG: hypothetical protein FMNOHCHN_03235 [Ignavibacteriaceae bacterium]|nr:hypothetical protein [Ignavibacteriaceae bacterium]
MHLLTEEQVRVIGALIEKEKTTPEYYPLSVNSLTNACNQKSSREPVVNYTEEQVQKVLLEQLDIPFVCKVTSADQRVPKYKQLFTTALGLTTAESAIMGVLMLRGAQTPGEIRSRSGRLYEFSSLEEVESVIHQLISRVEPLAVKLPRQPGRDARYAHLLSGMPEIKETPPAEKEDSQPDLIRQIEQLRHELDELKEQFAEFRKQFES